MSYGKDDLVICLVNSICIYIFFVFNLDGVEFVFEGDCLFNKGRNNVRDVDINLNFFGMYIVRFCKCRIVCDCELFWFLNSLNSVNFFCVFSKFIVFIYLCYFVFVL